jgi:hypothetical protein
MSGVVTCGDESGVEWQPLAARLLNAFETRSHLFLSLGND